MMIDNGINGILVPVGEDQTALCNAMCLIVEDPRLAKIITECDLM